MGFVLGPMIGAAFSIIASENTGIQWYILPAGFAFLVSMLNLFYVAFNLKESLPQKKRAKSIVNGLAGAITYVNPKDLFQFNSVANLNKSGIEKNFFFSIMFFIKLQLFTDLRKLRRLGRTYFLYLFVYSGLEFTLTFLTHYTFNFTKMQQGWMFLGIGSTMALLQGVVVRRIPEDNTKLTTELVSYRKQCFKDQIILFIFFFRLKNLLVRINFGIS